MKFSERSNTEKVFIIIIIIVVIGIILRWGFIKSEVERSFNFFNKDKTEQK
jgi:ABC-type nitrate/sulfonate/bicarbonate transport system permease component